MRLDVQFTTNFDPYSWFSNKIHNLTNLVNDTFIFETIDS